MLLLFALVCGCGTASFLHMQRVKLTPQLRAVLGGGGNSAVLLHGSEALVVDVKFGDFGRRLRSDVETELGRVVKRILLTHSHSDHAGSLDLYPEVGAVLVHPRTRARLQANLGFAVPWVEVERHVRLVLGGREVHVLYPGVGHTDGDLIAWIPDEAVLVSGDLFSQGLEPYVDPSAGGNLLEWRKTLDAIWQLPFMTIIPGHGEVATRDDFQVTRAYLTQLEKDVRAELAAGLGEEETVRKLAKTPSPLRPLLVLGTRERSLRMMYQAIRAEQAAARAVTPGAAK